MTAREELPEGWRWYVSTGWSATPSRGGHYCEPNSGFCLRWGKTAAEAIAAAWRIVDAEKEAGDVR